MCVCEIFFAALIKLIKISLQLLRLWWLPHVTTSPGHPTSFWFNNLCGLNQLQDISTGGEGRRKQVNINGEREREGEMCVSAQAHVPAFPFRHIPQWYKVGLISITFTCCFKNICMVPVTQWDGLPHPHTEHTGKSQSCRVHVCRCVSHSTDVRCAGSLPR